MFNQSKAPETQTKSGTSIEPSVVRPTVIGPTLRLRGGELSSDEDLVIEGAVDGLIANQRHQLTIGETGVVKANVHARIIIVEGAIEGEMRGDEAVHIGSTARVVGDVISPTVSIATGASFVGNVKTSQGLSTTNLRGEGKQASPTELAGSLGVRARRKLHTMDDDVVNER